MSIEAARLEVKVDADGVGSTVAALDRVDRKVEGTGGRFTGLAMTAASFFGNLGAMAVSAGFSGLVRLGSWGFEAAVGFELAQQSFRGMLGDVKQADQFLEGLKDFAKNTPFEMPEVVEFGRRLLATGTAADQVVPKLTILGDAASLLGAGAPGIEGVVRALGQMQGKGKASAEEMQQIAESLPGFNVMQAVADGLGVDIPTAFKLMEKGAVPAQTAIDAVYAGLQKMPGAAGAMDQAMNTVSGQWSNLVDTVRTMFIDVLMPYMPQISDLLKKLAEWIGSNGEQIKGWIADVAKWFEEKWPDIQRIIETTIDVLAMLEPVFRGIASAWILILGNISSTVRAFRGIWDSEWNVVRSVITAISNFVSQALAGMRFALGFFGGTVQSVMASVSGSVLWAIGAFRSLASGAAEGVAGALAWFRGLPGTIQGIFAGAGSWLISAGRRIIDGLVSGISSAIGRVRDVLSRVTDLIPDWKGPAERDRQLLVPTGRTIMAGLAEGLNVGAIAVQAQLSDFTATLAPAAVTPTAIAAPSTGGVVNLHVEFSGVVGDRRQAAREIIGLVDDELRLGGTSKYLVTR